LIRKSLFLAAVFGFVAGGVYALLLGAKGGILPAAPATLGEETQRLETELSLAAAKKPYLVLDLVNARLDYRLSGMTTKSIPFHLDSIRDRGKDGRIQAGRMSVLSIEDRGHPVEIIVPPDPDKPVDPLKDPKLFPPDPPTDFTLLFDRPFKVRFLGEKTGGWSMSGMGRRFKDWLPWGPGGGRQETRVQVRVPAERAQEIYRALYQGEKVLVVGLGESASP
jgi:hypothetical protein